MYSDRYYVNPAAKRDIAIQLLLLAIASSDYRLCVTMVGQIGAICQLDDAFTRTDITLPKCIELEFAEYDVCQSFFDDLESVLSIYEHTQFTVTRKTLFDGEDYQNEAIVECHLSDGSVVQLILVLTVSRIVEEFRHMPSSGKLAYYEPEVLFLNAMHSLRYGRIFGMYNHVHTIYLVMKYLYIRPNFFNNIFCLKFDESSWRESLDRAYLATVYGYYARHLRDTNEGTDNIYSKTISCLGSLRNLPQSSVRHSLWDAYKEKFVSYEPSYCEM